VAKLECRHRVEAVLCQTMRCNLCRFTRRVEDLSAELASVGESDPAFPLPHGHGDEFHHGSPTPDLRGLPPRPFRGRDIADSYGHISEIKVKPRDFR
jgi:error-prone DNA polymerase